MRYLLLFSLQSFLVVTALSRSLVIMTHNGFLLEVDGISRQTLLQRRAGMAAEHARTGADIIALQEIWGHENRQALEDAYRALGYQYFAYHSESPVVTTASMVAGGAIASSLALGATGIKCARILKARALEPDLTQVAGIGRRTFLTRSLRNLAFAGAAATGAFGAFAGYADSQLRDFGHGLMVVSKFPIVFQTVHNYRDFTKPEEFFLYRAVQQVRIEVGGTKLDLFNTHLGPRSYDYYEDGTSRYDAALTRKNFLQTQELAAAIKDMRSPTIPYILTGDLNFSPQVWENGKWLPIAGPSYLALTDRESGLGLVDSYAYLNQPTYSPEDSTDGPENPIVKARLQGDGLTPKQIDDYCLEHLDYILVDPKLASDLESATIERFVYLTDQERARYRRTYGVSEVPMALSDHFARITRIRMP